ncbi:hypothetical protein JCM3766R1_002515 [Sporobolomyces carnicolor]
MSWQTYYRDNRDEAEEALQSYTKSLKKEAARAAAAAADGRDEDQEGEGDEEEEEEEDDSDKDEDTTQSEPPKKKKKLNSPSRPSTSKKSKKSEATAIKGTKAPKAVVAVAADDEFDDPSPSESESTTVKKKGKEKVATASSSGPRSRAPSSLAPSASSSRASGQQQKQQPRRQPSVIELGDSSPPPPPRRPPTGPAAGASTSTAKTSSTSTRAVASTSKSDANAIGRSKSTNRQPPRPRTPSPPPPPLPPPIEVSTNNSPGSLAKAASNLIKAVETALPPDDPDDDLYRDSHGGPDDEGPERDEGDHTNGFAEPSTEDNSFDDDDDDPDDPYDQEEQARSEEDDTQDDARLVRELARIDWIDETKQIGFENLSKLYPWYAAVEWEERYQTRIGFFIERISLATEALEREEEDLSRLAEEGGQARVARLETMIVEELARCELLGIEKNPMAWDNLTKLKENSSLLSTGSRSSRQSQQQQQQRAAPEPNDRGPTTPSRSPVSLRSSPRRPDPSSEAGETEFNYSEYSFLPSPWKQESLFGGNDSRHEDQEIGLGREGEGDSEADNEQRAIVQEEETERAPVRTSTAETTQSDRELLDVLEKTAAGDSSQIGTSAETAKSDRVEANETRLDEDVEEDDEDDFDPSDPFRNYDPAEAPFSAILPVGCLALGHTQVLDGVRLLAERGEEQKEEEEEQEESAAAVRDGRDENDMTEMEREAEEWTRRDGDGDLAQVAEEKSVGIEHASSDKHGTQIGDDALSKQSNERPTPTSNRKKRARSEDETALDSNEREREGDDDDRRPAKKARKSIQGDSATTASRDVGAWREQVREASNPASRAAPTSTGVPTPHATSPRPSPPRDDVPAASPPREPRPAEPERPSRPLATAPAARPFRQFNADKNKSMHDRINEYASEFDLSRERVQGIYFCLSATSKWALFEAVLKSYSPTRRPAPSSEEAKKLERKRDKYEWTYEDDKALLARSPEDDASLAKRKSPAAADLRRDFLRRAGKTTLEKLPLHHYVRDE